MSDPNTWKPNDTPKSLYNPLDTDFAYEYRNEDNQIEVLTVPAHTLVTHPTYKADYLIKHLTDAVINARELGYLTPEKRKEIEGEIEVII